MPSLTSAQLTECQAFNELEPIGELDYRLSTLLALVGNFLKKKGARVLSVEDAQGRRPAPPKVQSAVELETRLRALLKPAGKKSVVAPAKEPKKRLK